MAGGAQRRERKVVTVVFCDLVGFTARAETMDPEDVEALLGPYHERVRSELERHGGTVEKFIGDAVMALFGAPTAHEDDPERAVRAALAIRDFAVDEGLELRIGITTGEALVRLDASPKAGEGMASGDVVNTAARLQSGAPVNGILVDETTFRATRSAIDYRDAESVEAKGKAERIAVWQATEARSRFGVDVAHEARADLVGRERELGVVRDAFERARHERTPQLLTLVGVPGIGKSRLVYELQQIVDADPDLITWRQGRCLAYGDGVTLWALSEIVKAQAGIAEQDSADAARAKIRAAAEDAFAGSDEARRVEPHLLALVGLATTSELGGDRRGAAFAAWRRFLEGLADQHPLVLVFEDLHWADESLLDFVDELCDWVTDAALLVVATSRPELLDRRPGWGGGKLNATTLALSPLSDEQTALLIAELLERSVLPAESQQALLERAGGNPLYAEQFVELYVEQGAAGELRLPETLQGIIAARLDGLPESEKRLLQDAAVVGKVFWVSSIGDDADAAATSLHALERKGFIRRQRRSSVEGEAELAFAHALVRDVAYGQIARADRAAGHRRVAQWIESLGRADDHAEMLAYHWRSALDLTRAAGGEDAEIVGHARLALRRAGDRAFALNTYPAAARYYEAALELWPEDDSERPELLFQLGHALQIAGDYRCEDALVHARDALLADDIRERAAEAEALLAQWAWHSGDSRAAGRHLDRARELVGPEASPARARVLAVSARTRTVEGDFEEGERLAREALAVAEALGLDELRAHALATVGTSKGFRATGQGNEELEQALEIALAIDSPIASTTVNNLAVLAGESGNIERAAELTADALLLAERFGDGLGHRFLRGNVVWSAFMVGRWDDAVERADRFIAECEAGSPHLMEQQVRQIRGVVRLFRDDVSGAPVDIERALELAREADTPHALVGGLMGITVLRAELGELSEARVALDELLPLVRDHPQEYAPLGALLPYLDHLDAGEAVLEAVANVPAGSWKDVLVASATGDYGRAAKILERGGARLPEARVRHRHAEQLIVSGRRADGEVELERALAFYREVRATRLLWQAEALLAEPSQSESA